MCRPGAVPDMEMLCHGDGVGTHNMDAKAMAMDGVTSCAIVTLHAPRCRCQNAMYINNMLLHYITYNLFIYIYYICAIVIELPIAN